MRYTVVLLSLYVLLNQVGFCSLSRGNQLTNQPVITLLSPQDSTILSTSYPVLSWSTSDITNDLQCSYQLKVVEIIPGQTKGTAILNNVPLWENGWANLVEVYPVGAQTLQPGKLYAWQVIANNASGPVSWSDVWVFSIDAQGNDTLPPLQTQFVELSDKTTLDLYNAIGGIGFRFDAVYGEEMPTWKIYDASMEEVSLPDAVLSNTGGNMLQLDLRQCTGLITSMPYIFKVWDAKGQVYELRFLYFTI